MIGDGERRLRNRVVYRNEAGDERVIRRDGEYVLQMSDGHSWRDAVCLQPFLTLQDAIAWCGE